MLTLSRMTREPKGNWQALADHIKADLSRLGRSQKWLAADTGLSTRTITDVVNAKEHRWIPSSVIRIESALRWPEGTAQRIVFEGAAPPPVERRLSLPDEPPRSYVGMRLDRIRREVQEDERWEQLSADQQEEVLADIDTRRSRLRAEEARAAVEVKQRVDVLYGSL